MHPETFSNDSARRICVQKRFRNLAEKTLGVQKRYTILCPNIKRKHVLGLFIRVFKNGFTSSPQKKSPPAAFARVYKAVIDGRRNSIANPAGEVSFESQKYAASERAIFFCLRFVYLPGITMRIRCVRGQVRILCVHLHVCCTRRRVKHPPQIHTILYTRTYYIRGAFITAHETYFKRHSV